MTPTITTLVQLALFLLGAVAGWAARDLRERRWTYSVRMKDGITPIPVRQTRERPPNEVYQEWHDDRWCDILLWERGPWYLEHYVTHTETKP